MTATDSPEALPGTVKRPREHFWWPWITCLLGLDYFSTLAYQPSITYDAAGRLGPVATGLVVLLTLLGALPLYSYLAGRSPTGRGSLGLLERLVRGWRGKTLVLALLGFAATDFTMLKSLSLADASVHVLNPHTVGRRAAFHELAQHLREQGTAWLGPEAEPYLTEQLVVTLILSVLGFVFWFVLRRGFTRNVLILSVPLVGAFLLLSGLLLGAGLWHLNAHADLVTDWLTQVREGEWHQNGAPWTHDGWGSAVVLSVLFLPNLALGLSGFEMSMILMPQVRGQAGESEQQPSGRVRNTRKVLLLAAAIMSAYLLAAVLVTTLLIPDAALRAGGLASHRSLAYLAHGGPIAPDGAPLLPWLGPAFGTAYDVVTVLVLCLAGTSVMTALAALLPHFLSRFGMEFRWVRRWGVMLLLFAGVNLAVTIWFQADIEDQRGAYATGVLVLICSACAAALADWTGRQHGAAGWLGRLYFGTLTIVFLITTLAVVTRAPSGLLIALCFIAAILGMSVVSRAWRADELRTIGYDFKDEQSKFLWDSLRLADFPVLVPHRPGRESRDAKERHIRAEHQLDPDADVVFVEVEVDDASNFYQRLLVEVISEGRRFILKVTRCASVPHAVAAIALEMSRSSVPPGVHFGWPEMNMLSASWSYLAFGEGNIPWKVRELIAALEPAPEKRPRVIVG